MLSTIPNGFDAREGRLHRSVLLVESSRECLRHPRLDLANPLSGRRIGCETPGKVEIAAGAPTQVGRQLGSHTVGLEPSRECARRQGREGNWLAARTDRWQDAREVFGDEDQHNISWRLLQRLQKGVGRIAVESVGLVDDANATYCLLRSIAQGTRKLVNLIDQQRLALWLDHRQVGMAARHDPPYITPQQQCCEGARSIVLTGARRPVQQIRVRRLGNRRAQEHLGARLTRQRDRHGRTPSSALQMRSATSASEPCASTRRTRAGSSSPS